MYQTELQTRVEKFGCLDCVDFHGAVCYYTVCSKAVCILSVCPKNKIRPGGEKNETND